MHFYKYYYSASAASTRHGLFSVTPAFVLREIQRSRWRCSRFTKRQNTRGTPVLPEDSANRSCLSGGVT